MRSVPQCHFRLRFFDPRTSYFVLLPDNTTLERILEIQFALAYFSVLNYNESNEMPLGELFWFNQRLKDQKRREEEQRSGISVEQMPPSLMESNFTFKKNDLDKG